MTLFEKISELIEIKDMQKLKTALQQAEDMELLQAFYELSSKEQVIVFRLLKKDIALYLFEELDVEHQQNLLQHFTQPQTIEFVNELAPDDRVKLLDEMPASVAKRLIASISPGERAATNILMGYAEETAGRIMTTEFISLQGSLTAEKALEKVRKQAKDKETIYTLFVTDSRKKLKGVLSLKELITASLDEKIEDIMNQKVISVSTSTDQEEVANTLKELDLLAISVVDNEERLVGIVTVDDALDILEDEATEDLFAQAGLADTAGRETDRSETLINGSLWKIWRVRLPFLAITLAGGILAGIVMGGFEEALESIILVAFFIPLIMDMGGSVGTQSSTVFMRGVVLGHISLKKFWKHFMKEIGVGFSIGIIVGSVAGAVAAGWAILADQTPLVGLAVGLAVASTATLASLLGFLVPYILTKLNTDQAAGAAPIITTIKDIAGLLLYFVFVSLLLGSVVGAEVY